MQIVFERTCITLELARELDGSPVKIHSPRLEFDLPSVMMNPHFVSVGDRIRYSRYNCFQRDDYTCQYCGDPNMESLTIDHVRPKVDVKGREGNLWYNRVTACHICNGQKGCRSIDVIRHERCWNGKLLRLIREPFEPSQASISRFVRLVGTNNLEWLDYIPGWERVAKRINKAWLIEAHRKWKASGVVPGDDDGWGVDGVSPGGGLPGVDGGLVGGAPGGEAESPGAADVVAPKRGKGGKRSAGKRSGGKD
jgi:hypothetical protein